MNHRTVIISFLALLLFGSCNQETDKPNILLIMADDVGRETLGCYGGTSYETPEIDALSSRGILFEHTYAAPVCHPTRLTLMTGQYPFRHGAVSWGAYAAEKEMQTFAHLFKNAGYATAVAGKWQLCMMKDEPDHPHRLGFDEYCLFGWHEGPRYHQPLIWQNGKIRNDVSERYGPDVYSDFLIDFMRRNKDRPFLAYYPMALIHDVSDDLEVPPPYGPDDRYENVKEMIVEMDRIVGKIMQALQELGLEENTLVIFTTDNGTNHNSIIRYENGSYVKEKVYSRFNEMDVPGGKTHFSDWGVRVPTIAVWPAVITEPGVCNELIDFSDFLPTLLDLAKLPGPDFDIDGKSFAGAITGSKYTSREWVYSQKDAGNGFMIRTRSWKLLGDGRLYDMNSDPYEENPIVEGEDTPESSLARTGLDSILVHLHENQ